MSNFRFGADDYKLSYYPPEASNGIGGVDWDKVEFVEIEFDEFVKVVRCEDCKYWRRFYPESEQRFGTCRAWRYTTRFDGYCHNASKVDGERQSE